MTMAMQCSSTAGAGYNDVLELIARCDVTGDFRRRVAALNVKRPENAPGQVRGKPLGCQVSSGNIPTLAQLGLRSTSDIPGSSKYRGGTLIQVWLSVSTARLTCSISLSFSFPSLMQPIFRCTQCRTVPGRCSIHGLERPEPANQILLLLSV